MTEAVKLPFRGLELGGLKEPCIRWGADLPRSRCSFCGLSVELRSIGSLCCSIRLN